MKYEFIRILSVCIFYFGLVYFLTFLTKSTTITLMAIILYTLSNIVFTANKLVFPLYYTLEKITLSLYLNVYLPLALVGIALSIIGVVLNKRSLKFI
jgi:hypothetical protein